MPQPKPLPPVELLRELFEYNPHTGVLINRVRRSNRLPGERAGTRRPAGYWLVGVGGKMYLLHRVAWKWWFGEEPEDFLDHKDTNPENNAIHNLRVSDYSGNAANVKKRRGYLAGTYKEGNKWSAKCGGDYLGVFDDRKEAHRAYVQRHLQKFGEFSIYAD